MPDSIGSIRLFERKKDLDESISVPSSLPKFPKHPLAEFGVGGPRAAAGKGGRGRHHQR